MGGTWERMIHSVSNALEPLLLQAGSQLDDETLRTLLTEVQCIINLLTMKPKRVLLPSGKFQRADMYCRRRWRRVQYVANEFWLRWWGEYLQMLQVREKWVQPKRNLAVGDIVISKESESTYNNQLITRMSSQRFVSMRYYVSGIDYYFIITHLPSHEKKTYLQ